MTLEQLRDYNCWLTKTPEQIFFAAKAHGGWHNVFPKHLPRWASKVRNYFNVVPNCLRRLPDKNAKHLLQRPDGPVGKTFRLKCHDVQSYNSRQKDFAYPVPASCPAKASHETMHTGIKAAIATEGALSDAVYVDEYNRPWYQMAAGASIFHFGRHPTKYFSWFEAGWQEARGQNDTPVFKLICPDTNGGSGEIILLNDGSNAYALGAGRETLADPNVTVRTNGMLVTDPAAQGSYNYSETSQMGYAAHELRDMDPHVRGRTFYVNPKNPYSSLASRKFPPVDLQGNPLADQKQ